MKRKLFTILGIVLMAQLAFAGGIVTNTNQSVAWVRMMARDASVDVDAVFFNPAGLTHLEDGFYVQVNSQTVDQTRTITSTFPGLNNNTYEGTTFVPFMPTAYLVYKKGNLAVSGGLTVIGGGGSADFDKGLPMFEYALIAPMATELKPLGVTKYSADISFKGTSVYLGFQGEISYKVNDLLSVAVGARYVKADNSVEGYMKNISYNFQGGDMVKASDFFTGFAQKLQPAIDFGNQAIQAGVGDLTLEQLKNAGQLSAEKKAQIEGTLKQLGVPEDQISGMTVKDIYNAFVGAQTKFKQAAAGFADKEIDITQSGSGIAPFFGIDLNLMDGNLGIALKYEMKTNMTVTTTVNKDDFGFYKDGEEVPAEMPAMFSAGLRYKTGGLKFQTGFHYYFDKDAKYGKKDDAGNYVTNGEEVTVQGKKTTYLEGNSYEFAIGAQYDLNSMLGLSAGFLMTKSNPNPVFQTALDYTLNTKTIGVGGVIHATSNLDIDLGFSLTSYDEYERDFGAFKETYDKTAMIFAIGGTLKL